jgi:hypothetical protein
MDGAKAYARVDAGSHYETYLPLADYKVKVENTTAGGTRYFNMQDLLYEVLQGSGELNLWADQTISVKGRVYWDKDQDGKLTLPEQATEINNAGGRIASEVAIAGIVVKFHYVNGTIKVATVEEGYFEAFLPPATYTMTVDATGFENYSRVLEVEDTVANRNFGINDTDVPLVSLLREIEFNVSYPVLGYGVAANRSASGIIFDVVSQEVYMEGRKFTLITDADGKASITLPPAEYTVYVAYSEDINGLTQTTTGEHFFFLEPGDGYWMEEVSTERTVRLKGTLQLIENSLVKYPAEVSIVFNPAVGMGETVAYALTDFNGMLDTIIPIGQYVAEAQDVRSGANYVLLKKVEITEDIGWLTLMMEPGFPITGTVSPAFDRIQDSTVLFRSEDVWTTARVLQDGSFESFLLPGEYQVIYLFSTIERIQGEDVPVNYTFESSVNIDGPVDDFRIIPVKHYQIHGSVYYDMSLDRTIQQGERQGFADMTFTSVSTGISYVTRADGTGDYRIMLPVDEYELVIGIPNYDPSPLPGYEIVDLNAYKSLWDIQVEPRMDLIAPRVIDWLGRPVRGMDFEIRSASDPDVVFEGVTDTMGYLDIEADPGEYNVLGLSYTDGSPRLGYVGRIDLDVGKDLTGTWTVQNATRVRGTVFFTDTDGTLHGSITDMDEGMVWTHKGSSAEFKVQYVKGTYSLDLPFGDYTVSGSLENEEYGRTMTYKASGTVTVDGDSGAEDYAVEFAKSKLYTFKIDLINTWEHELMLSGGSVVRLEYYIENTGNEPFKVSVDNKEKPEEWKVEYPLAKDLSLAIGERVVRQMNITVPANPDFSNKILVEGTSDHSTTNNFQVDVKTPPSYNFRLGTDRPTRIGIGFSEQLVFNVTVDNIGTGEDVVLLRMDPLIEQIEGWTVQWEGKDTFPLQGENVSLTPGESRSYAVTVIAPPSASSKLSDELTLTFTGKNRLGDRGTTVATLVISKPNLVLPPGFIKLTNRKLDDAALNRTVEANITVMSQYRAVGKVNVTLFVDGLEIANGYIPFIPQDGTGNVRIRFNVTDLNITEDDYHSIQVSVDPQDLIDEENEFDNVDGWDNVVIGHVEDRSYVNWRIVVFVAVVLLIAVAIIAYKQRTQPI